MGRARLAHRSLAVLLGLATSQAAAAAGFGATLGASSDNVFRGISESAGDPSVQAGAHFAWDGGAFAGLRGASTKQRLPYGTTRDTLELDAFVGYGFGLGDAWDARAVLIHYDYPWSDPRRRGYDELALSATWLQRVTVSAAASPDKPGPGDTRDTAYDYELGLRWPVADALSLDAGLGYYDLSRTFGLRYAYWSAGASGQLRQATLSLTWIGTDEEGRSGYGAQADNRVVASVLWAF